MGVTILLYLTKIVELIGEMSLKILFGEYTLTVILLCTFNC